MPIIVRKAVKEDMQNVLNMIQELADFEKMPKEPDLKVEDLIRDGGFDSNDSISPLFFCFIAEESDAQQQENFNSNKSNTAQIHMESHLTLTSSSSAAIGFALCFYTYSSWKGKALFMEDIYVKPSHRKLGIGKLIFTEVVSHARATNCTRLDFHVLDWNPARQFYEKLNAINLTALEGWQLYRLNNESIQQY